MLYSYLMARSSDQFGIHSNGPLPARDTVQSDP